MPPVDPASSLCAADRKDLTVTYVNRGIISSAQLSLPLATMPLGRVTASCGSALPATLLFTGLSRNWRFLVLRTLPYEKRFAKFVRLLNRLCVKEIVRRSKSHRIPLAAILE